ncbi:hypothetical protein A2U01_0097550, partial [Trifolium medium]|nr:hypothetical protein [Trifolium medium]
NTARRASLSCASRRLQKKTGLSTKALCVAPALAVRRAITQNSTALHSKNGASRPMLMRAAPEAEDEEIVAV